MLFVCVNYKNSKETELFCHSVSNLHRDHNTNVNVVIVDNSLDPNEYVKLQNIMRSYNFVNIVTSNQNLGYFQGLNLGLKSVDLTDYNYVIISNNDIQFTNDFLTTLLSNEYSKNVFCICPDIVTKDGVHQNPHLKEKLTWVGRLKFDLYYSNYYISKMLYQISRFLIKPIRSKSVLVSNCEIHMGIGACYVLTKSFFQYFNELDFPHFLYGEEGYLSKQIHSKNGILWFDNNLHVRHSESATLSSLPKYQTFKFAQQSYWNGNRNTLI